MSDYSDPVDSRRKFLKLIGGGVVLIPLTGLSGCSGEKESPAPAPTPEPAPAAEPEKAAEAPVQEAAPEPASSGDGTGGLPKLSEDDAQAKALGYVHDASQVDGGKYPRYQDGQACANCALFQDGGEEWAGCSIFPGRVVNAKGWCSAYAPKG